MSVGQVGESGRAALPVTAGIDWASEDHAVAIVDRDGRLVGRFSVAHTTPGLRQLVTRLRRAGVGEVAIERPDGPVVDALLDAEFTVFVVAPTQMKNLRGRYGSAGNKDDRFDAFVLADVLRTDRARMRPLTRDSEQTMTLRMSVRARQDLVHARVAMGNQLRAHLQITLPGAVGLFRDIDSSISLTFLRRFPSQHTADWLSQTRLANWLRSVGYNHQANAEQLWAKLRDAPRGCTGPDTAARAQITLALVAAITALKEQIRALEDLIADQLATHPDAVIFTSLPRTRVVRAARLLAEIGDARGRFPTADALVCLAGSAPSTRQSGKVKVVTFRWAVDKQLRGAVIDFAGDSWQSNPWAADLYRRARDRGHDHPHAVRILARAWLHIIWRCWQDHAPYDPAKHGALQRFSPKRLDTGLLMPQIGTVIPMSRRVPKAAPADYALDVAAGRRREVHIWYPVDVHPDDETWLRTVASRHNGELASAVMESFPAQRLAWLDTMFDAQAFVEELNDSGRWEAGVVVR